MKIIRTPRFQKDLKRLGASEADSLKLENAVASNPEIGDVMPGLKGLRKVRFSLGAKGKCGGGRAIYFFIVSEDTVLMIFAYAKSEQENLTSDQRKAALAFLREIDDGEENV